MSLTYESITSRVDYNQLKFITKLNEDYVDRIVELTLPYKDCLIAETKWLTDFEKIIEASGVKVSEEAGKIFKSLQRLIQFCFNSDFKASSLQALFTSFERTLNNIISKAVLKASPVHSLSSNSSMALLVNTKCSLVQTQDTPSCLLELNIDEAGDGTSNEHVSLILKKHILTDMVKGMSKIRNQLFDATSRERD